jgi:hypothetical protein
MRLARRVLVRSRKPPREKYPPIPRPVETDADNVVRQENAKGTVRPDGPGDETAPVEPDRTQRR